MMDIVEENLHCHHFLFIKDVIDSTYNSSKDCFKTSQTHLTYRKARLNGLVVAQEALVNEHHFWLDDGTSVIRVMFSQEMLKRTNGYPIEIASCLSVFGVVQLYKDKEVVIRCGGFRLEEDGLSEIVFWVKTLQDRPRHEKSSQTETKNMFYSLSSLPSPKRLMTPHFMESPLRKTPSSQNANTYIWSPDHMFATSTPMRVSQQQSDDDDLDDEFSSFGDVDLLALEQQAYSNSKRKWDPTME
ncbi:hypothetical protein BD560DRAFT_367368 [Blakeslea trispora]|nr:hypothetical protein BD560DRAFT_367368 [Blakeslea trispora]